MSVGTRFTLWVVVIGMLLVGSPVALVLQDRMTSPAARIACDASRWALTGAVAWLLFTTPTHAIRLPPRRSVIWLAAGTAWLALFACVRPDQGLQVIARASAIGDMIGLTLSAMALCLALARRRTSPWWTAVLAWNPAAIGPHAFPPNLTACALLIAAIAMFAKGRAGRPV